MSKTIQIADKPTLDSVNNKIDTLDTVADNIYSKVDTEVANILTDIGPTSATGGSTTAGTVMAKLNKLITDLTSHISSWTSTRAGYIDTIKTNTDNIYAKVDAEVASAVSNTATNNTASKTGVLSAKLAYVISLLENTTYGLSAITNKLNNSSGGVFVQRGQHTSSSGNSLSTATDTITLPTAIDVNKSVLLLDFVAVCEDKTRYTRGYIASSTSIVIVSHGATVTNWQVVTFT